MKRLLILLLAVALMVGGVSAAVTEAISFVEDGGNNYTVIKWTTNLTAVGGQDSTTWDADAAGATEVEYLVVAGGGGGAGGTSGGGGGAGGMRTATGLAVSGTINVKIGAGGAGGVVDTAGNPGANSSFGAIESLGGGYGGGYSTNSIAGWLQYVGGNGGSGGGAGSRAATGTSVGGIGTVGQGNSGGSITASGVYLAAGGGGKVAAGGSSSSSPSGNGGAGTASSISGASVTYAGGGGGGGHTGDVLPGSGGIGGGGNGTQTGAGQAGTNDLGGGGGGGGSVGNGGSGGSGVVIIRYLTPAASFTQNQTSGVYPLAVAFTSTSIVGTDTFNWSVYATGTDPTEPLATTENFEYTFFTGGNFTVNLTVTKDATSSTALGYVDIYNQTDGDFSANDTSGVSPLPVQFTATTYNATSWNWTLGDGNVSALQNPEHTYEIPGIYDVKLYINNTAHGTWINKTGYISVYCADFAGTPTTGGIPLLVTFTDLTIGSPAAWNWSFGDGTYSELQNPTHTYTTIGSYSVSLTATIGGEDCTKTRADYIHAGYTESPTVDFSANKTIGATPFAVQFTDLSTQNPTEWNWTFGGDGYSDDQNPIHTFTTPGSYFVNLTATNPIGSGTLNRSAYITVLAEGTTVVVFSGAPTSGEPGILVQFTDLSIVTNTTDLAYNWSFGDGSYSDIIGDVQHVYSYASVYTVTLAISNAVSNESETKLQYIVVSSKATTTWYNPHDVTVTVLSLYGQPLEEVRVSANYNETTLPATWITEYYGLQGGVASDALNATLFMNGYTGSDGAITYTMIKGIKYDFVLNSDTYGIVDYKIYAYTSDNYINFYVDTASFTLPISRNSTYSDINTTRIYVVEPDLYNVSMCIDYQDASGRTSSVTDRWIFKNNNTEMNATTFPPGITLNTHCYTIPNVRGTEVWWGWNATRLGV